MVDDKMYLHNIYSLQIASRFGFSRYIVSTHNMYLGASKSYVSGKVKPIYNLEWTE